MAIAVCKFSKIFQESVPPDPLEWFLVLKLLKIKFAETKLRLKKWQKLVPLPEKNSEYALDMKHFQKAYSRPFTGLNVFAFS